MLQELCFSIVWLSTPLLCPKVVFSLRLPVLSAPVLFAVPSLSPSKLCWPAGTGTAAVGAEPRDRHSRDVFLSSRLRLTHVPYHFLTPLVLVQTFSSEERWIAFGNTLILSLHVANTRGEVIFKSCRKMYLILVEIHSVLRKAFRKHQDIETLDLRYTEGPQMKYQFLFPSESLDSKVCWTLFQLLPCFCLAEVFRKEGTKLESHFIKIKLKPED